MPSLVGSEMCIRDRFTGVVPEIAARAHLERIVPVIDEARTRAGVQWNELDAIAVANEPGLAGSLLVGVVAAKALCLAHDLPLVAVNHLHAHIYACRIAAKRDLFPCVGLIVSGGHSNLYVCHDALTFEPLGATIDDAAGEAFDKVASMLQLPYPGGPSVSKAALEGDKTKYDFPRPMLKDRETLNLSFSGLKTAVRYTIAPQGQVDFKTLDLEPQLVADVSASFQQAVIDCLVGKTVLALEQTDIKMLCVGGGVAANRELRGQLEEAVSSMGVELHIAPFELCTDNAVMGAIAFERLKAGITESLDLDIKAGLVRMA